MGSHVESDGSVDVGGFFGLSNMFASKVLPHVFVLHAQARGHVEEFPRMYSLHYSLPYSLH